MAKVAVVIHMAVASHLLQARGHLLRPNLRLQADLPAVSPRQGPDTMLEECGEKEFLPHSLLAVWLRWSREKPCSVSGSAPSQILIEEIVVPFDQSTRNTKLARVLRLPIPRSRRAPCLIPAALDPKTMKDLRRPSDSSRLKLLFSLLQTQFEEAPQAYGLFAEFLGHTAYNKCLCQKLLNAAKQASGNSWDIRRLFVLMLEHQILKIHPDNVGEFDCLLTELGLKEAPGLNGGIVSSVLKEGYSTTDLRQFIPEFRTRLQRLNRVHTRIRGWRTSQAGLLDFIDLSRRDCKLSLARYLFTAEEVVNEILSHVLVTNGAQDLDNTQPLFVKAEAERALSRLPDFEASILKRLCASSRIYWVSDVTNSEVNSLVEYPLTTVVLVIKPPGSDIEFEIKRAGRRGPLSLNVVCLRNGYGVAPSHRLDGGNMQWLLRNEAKSAAKLGLIYERVHGTEAPIPNYVSRSSIYSIPANGSEVQTLTYFTEPRVFGKGFREMRQAMADCVTAFKAEGYIKLPDLPGDLGLTAQFISIVSPTQAILEGTSSFRLDRLASYLSSEGPRWYFERGLGTAYSRHEARRLADAVLEEVLGVYQPPVAGYRDYEQYVAAAFAVPENRANGDFIYLSLLQEIGRFWGTLLGVRGYSRGESFVARNVGLKSCWDAGQWKVKIVFMDHDSLGIPDPQENDFYAHDPLPGMTLDEGYLWGRPGSILGAVGHLRAIYRASDELYQQGLALARRALKKAYKKTQHELSSDPKLQSLFGQQFIKRLLDWDAVVTGFLRTKPNTAAGSKWKDKTRALLGEKDYEQHEVDACLEAIENSRAFLERQSFLFDLKG